MEEFSTLINFIHLIFLKDANVIYIKEWYILKKIKRALEYKKSHQTFKWRESHFCVLYNTPMKYLRNITIKQA